MPRYSTPRKDAVFQIVDMAASQSEIAEAAIRYFGQLYDVERDARTLDADQRRQRRQDRARPVADALHGWMVANRVRAGKRAAAIMSLIQSAKLNGHNPYAYLKDVFARLPSQPAHRIEELLPHRWQPLATAD